MNNVSAYPTYKQSGVQWLGDIPSHWETWKVTHAIPDIGSGTTPKSDSNEYYNGDILWVTTSELRENFIIDTKQKVTDIAIGHHSALKVFPKNSVAIAMYGATIGRLGILGKEATFNQACCVFENSNNLYYKFLFYWLLYRRPILISLSNGGGQPNLNQDDLRKLKIPIPPLSEQTAIAEYLDRETAKIDAILAKQAILLQTLHEQRTAIITNAVTKGLNPNVAMKNSGVAWLGDIPSHWVRMSLKYSLAMPITDGPHETPEILSEGIPFISAEAVKNDKLDFNKKRGYISEEDNAKFSKKYSPLRGDVYMVKSGATTGNVARVETDEIFNIWSPLAVMRPNRKIISTDFLFYVIKSNYFNISVQLKWNMGTQQNIGMGVLSNIRVFIPSPDEQIAIAEYLDHKTAQIDALCAKIEAINARLNEYRTALITNAVTGKIKVV